MVFAEPNGSLPNYYPRNSHFVGCVLNFDRTTRGRVFAQTVLNDL